MCDGLWSLPTQASCQSTAAQSVADSPHSFILETGTEQPTAHSTEGYTLQSTSAPHSSLTILATHVYWLAILYPYRVALLALAAVVSSRLRPAVTMTVSVSSPVSSLPVILLVLIVILFSVSVSSKSVSPTAASVLVDVASSRRPVSAAIYGTNFFGGVESSPAFTGGWVGSTRMGGGDPTTVYNWRLDADNAGFDWYFQQRPRAALANNSADHFVNSSIRGGAVAVVDVSSIGYVAAGREDCYSFPLSKFPNQQRHLGDMGNGLFPNGTSLGSVYGPQRQCYIESVPKDAVDFVAHLRELMGSDTFEAAGIIQLDNEPEWWSAHTTSTQAFTAAAPHTSPSCAAPHKPCLCCVALLLAAVRDVQHQDVHPLPFAYDEVWNMTRQWAGAIKAHFPNVRVMGGVAGGWWGMWCSALDGGGWHCQTRHTTPHCAGMPSYCRQVHLLQASHASLLLCCSSIPTVCACAGPTEPGPDYLSHNSTFYYPWLLQQINQYKREHGVCLIDMIDHHWYDARSTTVARRIASCTCSLTSFRSLLRCFVQVSVPQWH